MNGDITSDDVVSSIEFGPVSEDAHVKIDEICATINGEVNMYLARVGFAELTDDRAIAWAKLTKSFGAISLTIEMFAGQDTDEENSRAQRLWDRYQNRLNELLSSNGMILSELGGATVINRLPTVPSGVRGRQRKLRFPQAAAATHKANYDAIIGTDDEEFLKW